MVPSKITGFSEPLYRAVLLEFLMASQINLTDASRALCLLSSKYYMSTFEHQTLKLRKAKMLGKKI